jgi:predicted ferric reductase
VRLASGLTYLFLASFGLLPLLAALAGISSSDEKLAVRLGMASALTGFGLMSLQFVLSSRLRPLTEPIGLVQMVRWHRAIGIVTLGLLLAHPFLVSFGDHKPDLLNPLRAPWPVVLGQAALLLLLAHTAAALLRPKLGIDYVLWRRIHKGAYLIFALGFIHSFIQGDDLKSHLLQIIRIVLLCVVGAVFFHAHFGRPRRLRRNVYQVVNLIEETQDTTTVVLGPVVGRPFSHLPGQFMFLTPLSSEIPREEHPFTISSSPNGKDYVSATIKTSGDFTAQLRRLQPGDPMLVDGPYGKFSFLAQPHPSQFVFIGAGVGITPLMSMLRSLREAGDKIPCLLIYGSRTDRDIIFKLELEEMESSMNLRVIHVLSQPSREWKGEKGRVGHDILRRHVMRFRTAAFYVCGPPPMMDVVIRSLVALGVAAAQIYCEEFSL